MEYINPTATSRTLSRSAKSVKSSQAFWVRALRLEGRRVCCASSRRGIIIVVVVVGWVCVVKSDYNKMETPFFDVVLRRGSVM